MELMDMPKVCIKLYISGKEFIPQEFTKYINIEPMAIRSKEDWPQAIKNNENLPEHLKPRGLWSYVIEEQNCKDINIVMEKVIKTFYSNSEMISKFKREHKIEVRLVIIVNAKAMSMPAISLKNEDIVFWGSLGADISFDIYTYDEDE